MNHTTEQNFWNLLDTLLTGAEIIIDRPKGSSHPRYPQIIYPLDYGYIKDTHASDNECIDVWLGSASGQKLDAIICTVDLGKRDTEMKLLVGCTEDEKSYICTFYNELVNMGGILIRRYPNT